MSFPILFVQSVFCGASKACFLQNWVPNAKIHAPIFLNTQLGVKIFPCVKESITTDLIPEMPRLTRNESRQAPINFLSRLSCLGGMCLGQLPNFAERQ